MRTCFKILGLLIIIGMIGCEKEKTTLPSGIYLSKVIYHQNVDQIRHYYYNNQGLLSTREYEFNDIITERFDYQYKNGLISRIDYYGLNSYNDYNLYHSDYVTYNYESNNIIESTRFSGGTSIIYEYNPNNRVIKKISSSSSYTKYSYDNNGNIQQAIVFKDGVEYWKFFYEYDEKHNPFLNVEPIHDQFAGVDFIHFKCPNNLTKEIFINENKDTVSISEFIYQYNSDNLPIQSYELFTSESNGYDRDSMNLQLYEYEIK